MSNDQVLLLSGQIIGMLHQATAEELEAAAECLMPSYRRLTLELARVRRILEHLRDDGTVDGEIEPTLADLIPSSHAAAQEMWGVEVVNCSPGEWEVSSPANNLIWLRHRLAALAVELTGLRAENARLRKVAGEDD